MFGRLRGAKPDASGIAASTPVTQARYVIVDTELTGLDVQRDAIVSLGAVRMTGGTIHLGETFYRVVNPGARLTAESVLIHEITPEDVRELPGIEAVLSEFIEFCGTDVLVGHFTAIDAGFLERDLRRIAGTLLLNPVIDTVSVYTWLRKRMKDTGHFAEPDRGVTLYEIAKAFQVAVEGGHNALQDAFLTAQLLQRFLPMLVEAGARDIGDLLRIGAPFQGGDHHHRPAGEFSNF